MFIVTISLKTDLIPNERAEEFFAEHRGWFIKYVDRGNFLLLVPFVDDEHAGVVVVDAKNRKELDEILSQDVYHAPGYAEYSVREFKAIMGKIS